MENVGCGYYIYGEGENQNIMQLDVNLNILIDSKIFEESINEAFSLHPNISQKLIWNNNNFYFSNNDNRFYISNWNRMEFNNDFLFSVGIKEQTIRFVLLHTLADGSTFFPFVKSCLYIYLTKMKIEDFSNQISFRQKQYGDIHKYVEPFSLINNSSDLAFNDNGNRHHNLNSNSAMADIHQGICFRLSVNSINDLSREWKVSKLALLNAMLIYSIVKCETHISDSVSAYIPVDIRRELGVKYASHEGYSFVSVDWEIVGSCDLKALAGRCEEKLLNFDISQIALNNFKKNYDIVKMFQKDDSTFGVKSKLYKRLTRAQLKNQDTYSYSMIQFTGKKDLLNKYIESVSTIGINEILNFLVEDHQVGEYECVSISYIKDCDAILQAFEELVGDMGLLIDKKNIETSKIIFDIKQLVD